MQFTTSPPDLGMTAEAAIAALTPVHLAHPPGAVRLFIQVFNPGTVGGTPKVPLAEIRGGFDWDAGKVLLVPSAPLTALTPEDVTAIHQSVRTGQSWHAYKAWQRQLVRINELEMEVSALRARLAGGPSTAAASNE